MPRDRRSLLGLSVSYLQCLRGACEGTSFLKQNGCVIYKTIHNLNVGQHCQNIRCANLPIMMISWICAPRKTQGRRYDETTRWPILHRDAKLVVKTSNDRSSPTKDHYLESVLLFWPPGLKIKLRAETGRPDGGSLASPKQRLRKSIITVMVGKLTMHDNMTVDHNTCRNKSLNCELSL